MDIEKTCRFIAYFLIMRPPRHFLEQELQMSSTSIVDWTNFCRELLDQWLDNDNNQVGGSGVVVKIDEAKIGKRKYNHGRVIRGQWIFGAIERNSRRCIILPMENRSTETLNKIVQKHIVPGTIIYSDAWKGYNKLSDLNYRHYIVNHSKNFVDPVTGIHTQNIERLWRDMRSALPRYEIVEKHYKHYLAEFLFKRQYDFNERIPQFFKIMTSLYSLTNSVPVI